MDIKQLTIKQAVEDLRAGKYSASELVKACAEKIKEQEPKLNAVITATTAGALKQAKKLVSQKLNQKSNQQPKSLAGIPYTAKDVFCTQGIKTTAGSKILADYIPPYNAAAIKRLAEQEAILLGKTNTDEFTMGASTEYSCFGPTRNPFDPARVAGGSSGGSAAAVATGECLFSLGTDTGGSVRQPAAFCGVVGLKPTYGRISRSGVISMASSLDTIGTLTKTVADAAMVLTALAGKDPNDATTIQEPTPDYWQLLQKKSGQKKPLKGWKLGRIKEYFVTGLNPGIEKVVNKAIKKLASLGAEIVDVSLPHIKYALAVYYIICPSEVSSNLARYDGVKFGLQVLGQDFIETYFQTREQGFGPEVKRRIMIGTYCLSSGYQDQYYKQAQKVRTLVCQDFTQAFKQVDVLVGPTTPEVAFKIGSKTDDPLKMYLQDIFTVAANVAGVPALSLPVGQTKPEDGEVELPVGLQLIGPMLREDKILRVGYEYEKLKVKS